LGAIGLGIAIGVLDYVITSGLTAIFGEEGNILLVILSWTPMITMLFLGGLPLTSLVEWALRRTRGRHMGLALTFAVVAALVALYGTQQGMAISDLLASSLTGEPLGGVFTALVVIWAGLTAGGGLWVVGQVESRRVSGVIYLLLLLVAGLYYVWVSVRTARGIARWQQALAAVRGREVRVSPLQRGWLAIAAVLACITCSLVSLPFAIGGLSLGESLARLNEAQELQEQGELDQAVAELEAFVQEYPDVSVGHATLAMLYSQQGQFDRAVEEMEAAVELMPDSGVQHAVLAGLYYLTDRTDLAQEELQRAEDLAADDGMAQAIAADLYHVMRDLDSAEACGQRAINLAPDDSYGYLSLARVYATQGKFEQALALCDRPGPGGGGRSGRGLPGPGERAHPATEPRAGVERPFTSAGGGSGGCWPAQHPQRPLPPARRNVPGARGGRGGAPARSL
jgi:Tfp pilus assembly protein PilF